MRKLRNFWQRVIKLVQIFVQTVGFLSTILTILTSLALGTVVIGVVRNFLILIIFGLGILFISGLLFISFYSLLAEKSERKLAAAQTPVLAEKKVAPLPTDTIEYPPPPMEDIVILQKEIVYEYLADGKTIYQRKHLRIRLLRNNIRLYTDRYRWTGSGKCILRSLTPEFQIINQYEREEEEGTWSYFDVKFPHPYHKDDIIEFTIEWEMIDEEGKAVPFLSTMIDYDTNSLFLQVILPQELAPKRAYFHEFTDFKDKLPSDTRRIQWSPASKSIICEIPEPKKYHKYTIRWYNV